jgi:nucleoside 2-deoxyribosyltransferase
VSAGVRFYLNGGGLFTVQGRWWDEQVESLLGELGASVYNPWKESKEAQLREGVPPEEIRRRVFVSDRTGVDVSHGVIMLAEGAAGEVSSGTAWETAYAYARNKLVLCMRTDLRGALNPILWESLFEGMVCHNLESLREHAVRAIERLMWSKAAQTTYSPPARRSNIEKVFLSAPYFTAAEETFAAELERGLSRLGLDVMFPPGDKAVRESLTSRGGQVWPTLFKEKISCLDECDAVVALLEGADCSTEAGWDCGYGYSKYKPVFGMRTDLRSLGDLGGQVNLMFEQSIVDSKLCRSLDEIRRSLRAWH